MARRSVCSGTISFGLVAVPVKFYIAASAESVSFCYLSPSGNRVKQVYHDEKTGLEISRNEMCKGYEVSKNNIIKIEAAEIKALEEKDNGSIDIKEFVSADQVDLLHVEKSYHLTPDKGGDKSYKLLSIALAKMNQYAVAQWTSRGKVHLVIVRSYGDGLVLHQMYYADEIREFENDAARVAMKDAEIDMACKLINASKNEKYDPSKYNDTYKDRVKKFIEAKISGAENVDQSNVETKVDVSDLFAALQASLAAAAKKVA